MKTVIIILIILITIILMRKKIMQFVNKILGWMKPKKDKDPKTPPLEPLPVPPVEPPVIIVPEPPVEEPPVIVEPIPEPTEPEPTPEPPVEEVPEEKNVYHIQLDPNPEVDNTVSLQAQIDAIPDGTETNPNIIQFPEGRYWTEGDSVYRHLQDDGIVTIWNRKYLIIRGHTKDNKTILYTKAPATPYGGNVGKNLYSYRRHIWVKGGENIVIENIRVEGSNNIDGRKIGSSPELTPDFWYLTDYATAGKDWQYLKDENGNRIPAPRDGGSISGSPAYTSYWEQEHALDVRDSKDVIVQNFDVDGIWGDGIYVGGSTNTIIRDSHLRFTGRQGVAVKQVDGVLIERVNVELGRRADIDLENDQSGEVIKNVEIRNCQFSSAQTKIAANGRGDVSDIYIHNNTYSGDGHFIICYDSLLKTKRKNWRIENNTRIGGFGSPIADIRFGLTDNIVLKGNNTKVGATQSRKSAEFTNCQNVQLIENDFGFGEFIDGMGSEITLIGNTPEQTIIKSIL